MASAKLLPLRAPAAVGSAVEALHSVHPVPDSAIAELESIFQPLVRVGVKPFASLAGGPVFGTESDSSVGATIVSRSVTRTAVGGRVGAGFDVPFAGSWIFGMFGGYTLMSDFSDPIGSEENHSAPDVGIGISWTWGGGS